MSVNYYDSHQLLTVKAQTNAPLPPAEPLPILLTRKQVKLLQQFEIDVFRSASKNNLLDNYRALNRMSLGDKQILFQGKSYIGESLHQILNQN